MFRLLLIALLYGNSLVAATRPFVEVNGERLTVVSVSESGKLVLADGSVQTASRQKLPLQLEHDKAYEPAELTAEVTKGPELAMMDLLGRDFLYRFDGRLSEKADFFGVLIRTDERGKKIRFPVRMGFEDEGEAFSVSVNPFSGLGDFFKTNRGSFFYEFRLFSNGREVLIAGHDRSPLLVDWDRLESPTEGGPEFILPVVIGGDLRKKEAQVVVEFAVDKEGNTKNQRVVSKTAGWLEQPALSMVNISRLYPIVKDGKRVAVRLKVPIKYSLD